MSATAEISSIVFRWEMFVAKYSLPGKKLIYPNPAIMKKFTLELQKSHSKIDSTTTPNPLHMKIMQMTQNCLKNTETLKGKILFQK